MEDLDMIAMEETANDTTEDEKEENNIAWLKWIIVFASIISIKLIFTLTSEIFFG